MLGGEEQSSWRVRRHRRSVVLAEALNTNLYPEWIEYIRSMEVKQAFISIVGLSACLKTYRCYPQRKGSVRDFRFMDENNEQAFAFIVNQRSLLFYFRKSVVRSDRYNFETIRSALPSCKQNSRGEWTVRISTLQDMTDLFLLLKLN